jgi:hypothetical protein
MNRWGRKDLNLHCWTSRIVPPQRTALGEHWAWARPKAAAVLRRRVRSLAISRAEDCPRCVIWLWTMLDVELRVGSCLEEGANLVRKKSNNTRKGTPFL